MYAGYTDGTLLFAVGMDGREISAGTLHRAVGEIDSADFVLPPSNAMRDVPIKRASVISIQKDGVEIFRGSVVGTSTDLRGSRTYSVDGAMMWLGEICKPPFELNNQPARGYIIALMDQYNDGCSPSRGIKLGALPDEMPSIYVAHGEHTSMLALLQEAMTLTGCTMRLRYSGGDVYLDVHKNYQHMCTQQVDIRKNLLDLGDKIDGASLITRVYPTSKDGLTISSVNGGNPYLINAAAEALYGRIDGTMQADTDDPAVLKATAASYLAKNCGLSRGIEVSAADLSGADTELEPFDVGDSVRVVSPPHGIDTVMTVSKVDTSLVGDRDSLTLGWGSKSLTGTIASGATGSASGTPASGEVGTDNVIAQGTTGAWTWRKWSSGVAEMWSVFGPDKLSVATAWGGIYYGTWMDAQANIAARRYPFAFVAAPSVQATYSSGDKDAWLISDFASGYDPLTSAPAYALARPTTATILNPRVSYYVVGKYK